MTPTDKLKQVQQALKVVKSFIMPTDVEWKTGKRVSDIVAQALSLLPEIIKEVEASGWQDTNTAPKDGTEVLLINASGIYAVGHWDEMEWAGNAQACWFPMTDATHWQPLPARPYEN